MNLKHIYLLKEERRQSTGGWPHDAGFVLTKEEADKWVKAVPRHLERWYVQMFEVKV